MKVFKLHEFINQDSELVRILHHLPKPSENGPWLAGGAIWKAIENMPLDCDIDFFFKDKIQYEEYVRKLNSIPYVYHIVTEKKNDYNITFGFHIYERNRYNKTIPLQYISFRFCNSLEELLNSFDFTVCQFGFDGQQLLIGDTTLEDLKNRIIRFNSVASCSNTAHHVKKYLDKGFTVPPDQQQRFEELIRASGISPKKIDKDPISNGERSSNQLFAERLTSIAEDGYPAPRPNSNGSVIENTPNNLWADIPVMPTMVITPISIEPERIDTSTATINTSTYRWGNVGNITIGNNVIST